MSINYPEIDEIWMFAGQLQHVKEIKDGYIYYVVEEHGFSMDSLETYCEPINDFMDKSTYVGKSKARIVELFDVAD